MTQPIFPTTNDSIDTTKYSRTPTFIRNISNPGGSSSRVESETGSGVEYGENYINSSRIKELERVFVDQLIALIKDEDFEYGIETQVDALIKEHMAKNALVTKSLLNRIFLEQYTDASIVTGILRIISRFDYYIMYPEGQMMALAALVNKNAEIQECGIRAFENWETLDSLHILENITVSAHWLQEYVDEVIADLRRKYNVSVCEEN
jgi:hypothetical protein